MSSKHYRNSSKGRLSIERSRLRHRKAGHAKEQAALRALILARKDVPCMDCKKRFHPVCMDFDHRPDEIKLFTIGARRMGRNVLLAEIAKCDVVCANCHRYRTYVLRSKQTRHAPRRDLRPLRTIWAAGFGRRLKETLTSIGMTSKDLAKALRVSKSRVSGWTKGTFPMPPKHIKSVAPLLGVSVETVAGWFHASLLETVQGYE